jgi:hypothetical protein
MISVKCLALILFQNEYRLNMYREAKELYPENLSKPLILINKHTFCSLLHRNDRATMGASIECGSHFDYRLLAGLGSLEDKWLLEKKRKVHS